MDVFQLNRSVAPEFQEIKGIHFQKPETLNLNNGWKCYRYYSNTTDLMRIDFIIPIRIELAPNRLTPAFTARMINEGAGKLNSEAIAQIIDFCGAVIEANADQHYTVISLHALRKHLPDLLPILKSLFNEATFPEQEFSIMRDNYRQEFIVNSDRMSHLVRRHFPSLLFGKNHPYGALPVLDDYDDLSIKDLKAFYSNAWLRSETIVVITGNVQDSDVKLMDGVFSESYDQQANISSHWPEPVSAMNHELILEKADAMQSAIRIGCRSINRTNADYPGFMVLNTLLGGYFGSRLMTRIREEKGLTYGIGSGLALFPRDAMFIIQAEVKAENTKVAIDEIFIEIQRLYDELVPVEELNLVKNYILGQMLRGFDGVFNLSDRFKTLLPYNISMDDFYDNYLKGVHAVSPHSLKDLAVKYLKKEEMFTAVAGRME